MNMWLLYIVLVLFSLGGTAMAMVQIPASVKSEIDKIYSSYSVESSAMGDLNNDGIADYAAVIRTTDKCMCSDIIVFLGKSDGSYYLYAKSKELKSPQRLPELFIDKQSLFVSTNHNSLSMASGETYQFKFMGTELYLIGIESHAHAPVQEDNADTEKYEDKSSYNFLTGDEVLMEERNKNKTVKTIRHKTKNLQSLKEFKLITQ